MPGPQNQRRAGNAQRVLKLAAQIPALFVRECRQFEKDDVGASPWKLAQVLAHHPGPRDRAATHEVRPQLAEFELTQVMARDLAEERRLGDFFPGALFGGLRGLGSFAPEPERTVVVHSS